LLDSDGYTSGASRSERSDNATTSAQRSFLRRDVGSKRNELYIYRVEYETLETVVTNVSQATPMAEKDLQAHVELLLRSLGWMYYHTHDSRRSVSGFPDLVALRGRRMVVIELKSQGGKATPEQRQWLKAFAETGVDAYIVYGDAIDELATLLA
jgi:hypothetical protein